MKLLLGLIIITMGCSTAQIFSPKTSNSRLLVLKEKKPPDKDELIIKELVGLSEGCAILLIESYRMEARVTSRDGDIYVDDDEDDYRPNRINLDIVDGAVFYVSRG